MKMWKFLLATASWILPMTGCGESIGRDDCFGEAIRCELPSVGMIGTGGAKTVLRESDAPVLAATWVRQTGAERIARAADGSLWAFKRNDTRGALDILTLDANDELVKTGEIVAPAGFEDGVAIDVQANEDAQGIYLMMRWTTPQVDGRAPHDEIVALGATPSDDPTRLELTGLPGGARLHEVRRDEEGDYVFLYDANKSAVRKVNGGGQLVWEQTALPWDNQERASLAVLADGRLGISVNAYGEGEEPAHLWVAELDSQGNVLSLAESQLESAYSAAVARGDDLFVAATGHQGDLDLVRYAGAEEYVVETVERTGSADLQVWDVASDPSGLTYVLAGARDRTTPAPFVCTLGEGEKVEPDCHQLDTSLVDLRVEVTFPSLVALRDGVVFLSYNDGSLVRADLRK